MQPFLALITPVGGNGGSGGSPPGIWGGGNVPMPTPPIPIYPGGTPNPPGIWGPPGPWPGPGPLPPFNPGGGGGSPPGIWGGGNVPMPNPPIHLGPGGEIGGPPGIGGGPIIPPDKPPDPVEPPVDWKAVWHPTEGWVVVGIPTVPHPTPSSGE